MMKSRTGALASGRIDTYTIGVSISMEAFVVSEDRAGMFAQMISFVLTPAGVTFTLTLLGFAAAVGTTAYNVGRDVGDRSSAAYRTANEMDLTGLLKSMTNAAGGLKKASSEFSDMMATSQSYQSLKQDADKLQNDNLLLRRDLREKADLLERTQDQLETARGDLAAITKPDTRHELGSGRAVLAGSGLLNIGLIESGTESATLNINGKQLKSYAGDEHHIPAGAKDCIVRVNEVGINRANISAQCEVRPVSVASPPEHNSPVHSPTIDVSRSGRALYAGTSSMDLKNPSSSSITANSTATAIYPNPFITNPQILGISPLDGSR
jgi:hypothetical protein